jgi:hypothetical protein
MTTTSPFQTPASITSETSGKPPATTGDSEEKSDYSIEDLLIDQALMPKKRGDKRHKAIRLLTAGRLRVLRVEGRLIVAECRGDSGEVYKLGHDPRNNQWRCACPAKTDCSHLCALWAVVSLEGR